MSDPAARSDRRTTRPRKSHYEVDVTRMVAEAPGLRVLEITQGPGARDFNPVG